MLCCLVRDSSSVGAPGALEAIARACSPRVEPHGDDAVVFDAGGLTRALGPPAVIAAEVRRLALAKGVRVRVALAGTMTAGWLLAHARPGVSIVEPGRERAALAAIPIRWLAVLPDPDGRTADRLAIFERWGIRTLGECARLSRADLHARFGPIGVAWHLAASGEDAAPIVPAGDSPRFVERLELDWPIEGLEPLSFVARRLCDALSAALERADRGAVTITTRVGLVTHRTHERTLRVPAPMRDARVLRTLILLDLESHPPDAAIDTVEIELGVTPGRIVQGALFVQTLPRPEEISTLVARLRALAGESRVGTPRLVDTHDERPCAMGEFTPGTGLAGTGRAGAEGTGLACASKTRPRPLFLSPTIRRFRLPVAARVVVAAGAPVRIEPSAHGLPGGRIVQSAGPWRSSGHWWALDQSGWDRDAWDVELADGHIYRIAHDRISGRWEVEGTVD
jgi:protein ImuB